MKISRSHKKNKKVVLVVIAASAILFLVAALSLPYTPLGAQLNNDKPAVTDTVRDVNSVDYSGPSETDVAESQNGKKNGTSESSKDGQAADSSSQSTTVPVAISYVGTASGKVEIRAFTPGTIEGNGTCTAVLTKGQLSVEQSSKAFIDAASSQCEPIYIDISKFSQSGSWELTVTYTSPTHKGASDPERVNI